MTRTCTLIWVRQVPKLIVLVCITSAWLSRDYISLSPCLTVLNQNWLKDRLGWFLEGKVKPGPLFSAGRGSPTVTDRHEASWVRLSSFSSSGSTSGSSSMFWPRAVPEAGSTPTTRRWLPMRGGHCAAATAAPGAPRPRPGLCQHLHAFCLPEGPLWSSHDLRSSFCTFLSAASHAVAFFLILVATPASYSPQSNLPPPNSPPKANTNTEP